MSDEGAGAFLIRLTAKLAVAGVPNMVVGWGWQPASIARRLRDPAAPRRGTGLRLHRTLGDRAWPGRSLATGARRRAVTGVTSKQSTLAGCRSVERGEPEVVASPHNLAGRRFAARAAVNLNPP